MLSKLSRDRLFVCEGEEKMNPIKMKNKINLVNKFKLIHMPLLLAVVSILGVSMITFYINKTLLMKEIEQNGLSLARQAKRQIVDNYMSLETVNELLEDKIKIAGNMVIENQHHLSSEYLSKLANQLDVDELHWMNKNGKIIYSSVKGYLNWVPYKEHPLSGFVQSKKTELIEKIRPDAKYGIFMKYGAFKNTEGSFVQVGILAHKIKKLTDQFNYQNTVEKIGKEKNVIYAVIMDKNLKVVADSNKEDIGVIYEDNGSKTAVLKGKPYTQEWYQKKDGIKVYDITVPLIINGKITGAVAIGLSMESVHSSLYHNAMVSSIIAVIMVFIFLWIQNKNIIIPVKRLNQNINQIDIENNLKYRMPLIKEDTFWGISHSINTILDKTYTYFCNLKENEEELKASNQELGSAFQQIVASEEELRAQYDEIQTYAQRLEDLKQKYNIAIKGSNSAVWEINVNTNTIYISDEFKNIVSSNFDGEKDIYKVLDELLLPEDKEILKKDYYQYKKGEIEEIYNQLKIKDNTGGIKWLLIRGKGVYDSKGNLNLINGIALDITQIKAQEEYIAHLAYHDPLTDLPNRRMFERELKEEIVKEKKGAVMLLDLDNFKGINDTLGHTYGDKVLKKIAKVFMERINEKVFISRFGGDEFLFLIKEENRNKIEEYARHLTNLFEEKIAMEDTDLYLSFSMGITQYPGDSKDVNELIMNADTAMYKVKYSGKNNYMFFNKDMTERLKEKIEVENILRKAIKEDGFKLVYQPQVHVLTGEIIGFEALLRLKNHPISPGIFIPIAEEVGVINEIGEWITKDVVTQIDLWKTKGFDLKPIAINISPKQLNDEKYILKLGEILKEKKVEPKYLEIEITENVLLERTEASIKNLKKLKNLGVKIALDDFGTGYSSLSYLTFVPVDKIKLDKSLNDKFLEIGSLNVIKSLILLAHSLNLEVTAEGIEDIRQYEKLKSAKCDYIQGYLFSKPLPINEIEHIYDYNFLE